MFTVKDAKVIHFRGLNDEVESGPCEVSPSESQYINYGRAIKQFGLPRVEFSGLDFKRSGDKAFEECMPDEIVAQLQGAIITPFMEITFKGSRYTITFLSTMYDNDFGISLPRALDRENLSIQMIESGILFPSTVDELNTGYLDAGEFIFDISTKRSNGGDLEDEDIPTVINNRDLLLEALAMGKIGQRFYITRQQAKELVDPINNALLLGDPGRISNLAQQIECMHLANVEQFDRADSLPLVENSSS